jgi:protein-L-isoaspartate(D-aspartate) O-methyltransferase
MDYERAREEMVAGLERSQRVRDDRVLDAMRAVPRHEFLPEGRRSEAYRDCPLPIGHDQTVSAPHMVAIICDLLDADPGDDVLEVGTGCGYHVAVTAELVAPGTVYTVEYVPELAQDAPARLDRLGYDNVVVHEGDGHEGWPEHAPYDAAYLTAAPAAVPDPVIEQVRPGGRVVAPVGRRGRGQELVALDVGEDGVERHEEGAVRFVPMRGG